MPIENDNLSFEIEMQNAKRFTISPFQVSDQKINPNPIKKYVTHTKEDIERGAFSQFAGNYSSRVRRFKK